MPYPLFLGDQKQINHRHHSSPLLAELLLSSLPKPVLDLLVTANTAAVYGLQAFCCFCCQGEYVISGSEERQLESRIGYYVWSSSTMEIAQGSTEQHQMSWCSLCAVPTTTTLLQSIWGWHCSFYPTISAHSAGIRRCKDLSFQMRTLHVHCHGCSCRVVPPPPCPKAAVTAKGMSLTGSPREEELKDLHEPEMIDGCCLLLSRKGKCCLEYFDMLEMSHGNSLFCSIRSPFQIEKIANIRIAIFSFQAIICWVLVTTQRSL